MLAPTTPSFALLFPITFPIRFPTSFWTDLGPQFDFKIDQKSMKNCIQHQVTSKSYFSFIFDQSSKTISCSSKMVDVQKCSNAMCFCMFLADIAMGIFMILWVCLTVPPVKWGFSICFVSHVSLLSSLLLLFSLRSLFCCLSQFRCCPPASFETSSYVFRSFAFVFCLLPSFLLRNFFAWLSQFRYCLEGRWV